jgi:tetratricopeptide (TPR) repeat protein
VNARKLIPFLLVIAALWAYHNSFQGPFISDDLRAIPDNPHIRHLWPLSEAMVVSPMAVQGRPVACLTLALNYALDGLNVRGYHAFNLIVHVLAALVLFGILRRTFESEKLRDRFGAAAVWLAAAIALIWEVHPLQTECVDYIVQRSESLMGLFLLLTLYCTLRGSQSSRPGAWYLAAVVSCALGMGSKEVMVGAPLIVLLYDRVFLAPSFRDLWRRRIGLYVGLAATWLLLAASVAKTIHHHPMTGFGFQSLTPWAYLRTEAGVIVYYLRLCFWPRPLVIDYFDWPIASSLEGVLVPGAAVIGLLGATLWAFRRRPWLGFLGAWFFLILGATSSFLPSAGEVAAERRMYLPLAAVVTLTVIGAFALGKRLWNKQQSVVLGCVATASVVALLTILTIQRNQDYKSALTISRDAVEKRPNNPRAHNGLGLALMQTGKVPEAFGQFERALQIKPDYLEALLNLGLASVRLGKIQDAIGHWEQALRIQPHYAEAHNNLGIALAQLGKLQQAMEHWEQAIRFQPDFAEAHNNLGLALAQVGKVPEAIGHYEQAIRLQPDFAMAQNNLGVALAQVGRLQEAIGHYEQAIRFQPHYAEAHNNLGVALAQVGRLQEATVHYEQAIRFQPDFAMAHNNLGNALLQAGKVQEAIGHYEQAIRFRPDFAMAHKNLGDALVRLGKVPEAIEQYKQALRIQPDSAEAHFTLGSALEQAGRVREALKHYEEALRIKPDGNEAQNNLAWLLATLAPENGGNPVRGLGLAQRVCELTHNGMAPYLDTLAAAYAATGQFSNAVATAEKAIDLARSAGQPQVVKEIEPRLELYRNGQAYHQPAVAATSPPKP